MNELSERTGLSAPLLAPFCTLVGTPVDAPASADHAFDPFIGLAPAKREALLSSLAPRCEAVRPHKRERKWKTEDYSNFCSVLALVVANALSAAQHPLNQRVHYSRTNKTYAGHKVYHPDFLKTPTLKSVVDALSELGMLELGKCISGYGDVPTDPSRAFRQQSTFRATDQLLGLLKELEVSASHVVKSPDAPVIHLHRKSPEKEGARKTWKGKRLKGNDTELVEFDHTDPAVAAMMEAVRSYNTFLAGFVVSLDLNNAELLAMHATPRKDGNTRPPINTSQKTLFRSFNNDFEHGGRFFGGWWIHMPSEYRDHILIDGVPTVELDYSGCFIRILYHLEGIDLEDDPYAIPAIKEAAAGQKLDWKDVREGVKDLTNIYINALDNSRIGKFPEATSHLPRGLKRPNKVYPLIHEHHKAIGHRFRSGCATSLMKVESDICQSILQDGVRDGVPVLPVHDSFVVPERYEGWLWQAMTENYRKLLVFDPKIKRKGKDGGGQAGRVAGLVGAGDRGGMGPGITSYLRPVSPSCSSLGENVRDQGLNFDDRPSGLPEHNRGIWAAILAKHQSLSPTSGPQTP